MAISFIAVVASFSQTFTPTVLSSGGDFSFSADGFSINYTLGESFVKTSYINPYINCEGFNVGDTLGREIDPITDIIIYPNPLTGDNILHVNLKAKSEINAYAISIFTMHGQIIYLQKVTDIMVYKIIDIDFSKYNKGMYLVKIQAINGQFLRTFKLDKL